MANGIEQIRLKRLQYINKLYEILGGSRNKGINCDELGKKLGFSGEETDDIVEYLKEEGLLEFTSLGGQITITHRGIVEVETALLHPDEPTHYFPPANIILVGQMIGSQIQQGTINSTQQLSYSKDDINSISKIVNEIKGQLSKLGLDPAVEVEAAAEIATIETQTKSPKPKFSIIKECLSSLRTILEGIAGNTIAALLIQQITPFIK
jgi:hypothetical protein